MSRRNSSVSVENYSNRRLSDGARPTARLSLKGNGSIRRLSDDIHPSARLLLKRNFQKSRTSFQEPSNYSKPNIQEIPPEIRSIIQVSDERQQSMMDDMRPAFDGMQLCDLDLQLIRESFENIDVSRSGTIDIKELETFLKIERAPFNRRVLAMFDADKSGELDFFEFLMMTWNFCSLDKRNLGKTKCELCDICPFLTSSYSKVIVFFFYNTAKFVFDLYNDDEHKRNLKRDAQPRSAQSHSHGNAISNQALRDIEELYAKCNDNTGDSIISTAQIHRMIQDVYGKGLERNVQARKILHSIPTGVHNLNKFLEFMKTHQSLLFPTFLFQQKLRNVTGGEWFWSRHTALRNKIPLSDFVSAITLMREVQERYPEIKVMKVVGERRVRIKRHPGDDMSSSITAKNNRRELKAHFVKEINIGIQATLYPFRVIHKAASRVGGVLGKGYRVVRNFINRNAFSNSNMAATSRHEKNLGIVITTENKQDSNITISNELLDRNLFESNESTLPPPAPAPSQHLVLDSTVPVPLATVKSLPHLQQQRQPRPQLQPIHAGSNPLVPRTRTSSSMPLIPLLDLSSSKSTARTLPKGVSPDISNRSMDNTRISSHRLLADSNRAGSTNLESPPRKSGSQAHEKHTNVRKRSDNLLSTDSRSSRGNSRSSTPSRRSPGMSERSNLDNDNDIPSSNGMIGHSSSPLRPLGREKTPTSSPASSPKFKLQSPSRSSFTPPSLSPLPEYGASYGKFCDSTNVQRICTIENGK